MSETCRRLAWRDLPILQAHAFYARTDPDVDHAGLDRIRDINTCLQAAAALSVQTLDGRALRKAGRQRRRSKLRGATAWRKHGAHGDVLDERRGDMRTLEERLEGADEEVGGRSVFECTPATFREWGSKGAGHDHIVGVFG